MLNRIIGIGEEFPTFSKKALVSLTSGEEFQMMSSDDLKNNKGQWAVMFWWPKDFSGLCPTELVEFNASFDAFKSRNTMIIGASTDSEAVHKAWRTYHSQLKDIKYPMLADTSKSLAEELGILEKNDKIAYRATFIINPEGIIKWVSVYDLGIGRNVEEVLRVLDALQSGGFTPCNWQKGDKTL